jgi:hypothetical protein
MSIRPDIPVVPLREVAEILGVSVRAAESALRHHGIRSGYPRAVVEWLRDSRPGRGNWGPAKCLNCGVPAATDDLCNTCASNITLSPEDQ